ncbi:hypothetical protein CPB85DRAFT_523130 [Mucidula mucida]|nr:hypothetical protein CPB85DRAFT_523130 [Mucidula mucida]
MPHMFSNEPAVAHSQCPCCCFAKRVIHLLVSLKMWGHLSEWDTSSAYLSTPRHHHILLQWLSHAFSGIEGGNLEQLHITILLRNTFVHKDRAILDTGYWRGLDVALSSKSVPNLRSVHVRLAYSFSAVSILLLVRDTIRAACEGLEQRQLLSFELDERRGELVSDYQTETEHGLNF